MAKECTREEYEKFRKRWNAAHDRMLADRQLVVLDLSDAPPWREADIDFDEGVDVEFDEPGEAEEVASEG